MLLDIALANSRHTEKWSNRQIAWSDLRTKLSITRRTPETLQEYMNMPRSRQDEIKDVGGFVGGYLNDGVRRKGSVRHRQILTLDADSVDGDFWGTFQMLYAEEAVVYSTHKHTPENPRLRLVMPLSRKVSPEEYEALGRKIAGDVNIEWFDPTTFQPERLMYWPSTSEGAEFYYKHQQGEILDVDEVLSRYVDWKDISAWPRSASDKAKITREGVKQGEPTEKPGAVGAFCRAFNIHSAIETFLPEIYESTVSEDRYTFLGGSTAGGAVVYSDGAFLFSHHATDPVSGMCVNAFDLVRIHKFGDLDSEKDLAKPIHERTSFTEMCSWALGIPEVVQELDDIRSMRAELVEKGLNIDGDEGDEEDEDLDLDDIFRDDDEIDVSDMLDTKETKKLTSLTHVSSDNWKAHLERNKKTGELKITITNLRLILEFDEAVKGKLALNEFENFIYVTSDLPWGKVPKPRRWTDHDDSGLRAYIENHYGIYHVGKVQDAMVLAAVKHKFHPVREYLDGLEWDGVKRLDTLLIDYLGADDTRYVRAVTRKAFAAAVARIYRPGCKFDYVLTLAGPEGIKKSGLLTEMGSPWFSDSFHTVTGKEAYEQLQGSWIIEIAELSAFNKAETNAIKAFVTKREDKYRSAYGKHVQAWPRQSVFFATTNEPTFLKGHTGNRRFWPVAVTKRHEPSAKLVNDVNSPREVIVGLPVDQLWAEAKFYYKEGEPLYLEDPEIENEAKLVQNTYSEIDERVGLVIRYLDTPRPENWESMSRFERRAYIFDPDDQDISAKNKYMVDAVCPLEIWCEGLGMRLEDFNTAKGRELRAIMNMVPGWKYVGDLKVFGQYGRQRYFERLKLTDKVKC